MLFRSSAKTVRNINQVISSAMELAKSQKLIITNPTDGCALPKVEHQEMKTLTADQLAAFFREAKNSGVFEMYYLELATGLRRGELLGLKWDDINLETGVIQVKRQVARIDGEVVEAPLKTKNSYRTLSIGADAVEILKEQRDKVSGYLASLCSPRQTVGRFRQTASSICYIGYLRGQGYPRYGYTTSATPFRH